MKPITTFIVLFFILFLFSCENESIDSELNSTEITISSFIQKTLSVESVEPLVLDSTYYHLENNKILSYDRVGNPNDGIITSNADYVYENDRITEINHYRDGLLINKKSYRYVVNNLSERIHQYYSYFSESYSYLKTEFSHTNDTIFGITKKSTDGLNYNETTEMYKLVLDNNDNLIYEEKLSVLNNNRLGITFYEYDNNNNLITEEFISISEGVTFPTTFINYTYSSNLNPEFEIYESTFGRKTFSMIYPLNNNIINDFGARRISRNSISTLELIGLFDEFTFDFISDIDLNNYSVFNSYITLNNGIPFDSKTTEFIIEE